MLVEFSAKVDFLNTLSIWARLICYVCFYLVYCCNQSASVASVQSFTL